MALILNRNLIRAKVWIWMSVPLSSLSFFRILKNVIFFCFAFFFLTFLKSWAFLFSPTFSQSVSPLSFYLYIHSSVSHLHSFIASFSQLCLYFSSFKFSSFFFKNVLAVVPIPYFSHQSLPVFIGTISLKRRKDPLRSESPLFLHFFHQNGKWEV